MKHLILCLLAISSLSLFAQNTINPVIGDTSYLVSFGMLPDETTNEQLRIQTHLLYAEQRLRSVNCDNLTEEARTARIATLDHLHTYALRGQFPQNTAYAGERRPCFIDDNGTICAVGYLVEQTAGREMAEMINRDHQYDYVEKMQLPQLETWAQKNGLTVQECAMIQPAYGMNLQVVRFSPLRIYAGYAMAFSKDDVLKTGPGFEIGGTYTRHLFKRVGLQAGLGYVMRNQSLYVSDGEFALKNERWSASLLFRYYPNFKWNWVRPFNFKAGVQVDFFDISSPFSVYDAPRDLYNLVVEKKGPEAFAAAEICYNLKPNKLFNHSLSVVYMQGLRQTFRGEVLSGTETLQTYDNKGSYLSVRYAFQLKRRNRY